MVSSIYPDGSKYSGTAFVSNCHRDTLRRMPQAGHPLNFYKWF